MSQLYAPDGQPLPLPDEQVQDAVVRSQGGFLKGTKVPVLSPDGVPGEIPAEEAPEAFRTGYTYAPKDVAEAKLQAAHGTGIEQLKTAGEGLARGASFGASDWAETRLLGVKPEDIKARQEANPVTSTVSEIGGAVLPMIASEVLSGGAATPGVAANVARIAGAAPLAVAKLGAGVETAASGALNVAGRTGLTRAIAAAAARGAGAAFEGGLYGAGHVVSEAALGNPDLNAEHALSQVGIAALTGGTVGAGLSLAGSALKAIPWSKYLPIPKGTTPEEIEEFAGQRAFKAARPTLTQTKTANAKMGGVAQLGDDWWNEGIVSKGSTAESSLDAATGKVDEYADKIGQFYNKLDHDTNGVAVYPTGFFDDLRKAVIEPMKANPMLRKAVGRVSDDVASYEAKFEGKKWLSFNDLWTMRKEIDGAINWNIQSDANYNGALTHLRNAVQDATMDAADTAGKALVGPADTATSDALKELNRKFASMLFAKDLFAARVAKEQTFNTFSLTDWLAAIGGVAAEGPFGAAAGLANKFLLRERGNQLAAAGAYGLAALQRAVQANQAAIGDAVQAFLGPGGVRRAVTPAAVDVLLHTSFDDNTSADDRVDGYDRQIRQIRELNTNPNTLVERLGSSTEDLLGAAPQTVAALQSKTQQAVAFLASKAPPPPATIDGQRVGPPTDTEMARWARYVRAVQDPLTVLQDMASGRLSEEGLETLRTVYPQLYGELSKRLTLAVTERLAEGQPVSYPQRQALSRFLGAPVDGATAPGMTRVWQQAYAREQAQENAAKPKPQPPRGGRGGRNLITMETPTQRLENR